MIQLTRKGVNFSGSQENLRSLRKQYEHDNYLILPQLYEPQLLDEIVRRVDAARFLPRDHHGIGFESCMADYATTVFLMFFPNNPVFLRLIEQITGRPQIGEFSGRVYRMTASEGHYDQWHDDAAEGRVVTMSVNLSRHVFSGGSLQMKRLGSEKILQEVRNTGFGDALLFRISPDLVHRVESVKGDVPKTAFAGWFLQGEDFLSNLHKRIEPSFWETANDDADWKAPAPRRNK